VSCSAASCSRCVAVGIGGTVPAAVGPIDPPFTSQGAPRLAPAHHHPIGRPVVAAGERPAPDWSTSPIGRITELRQGPLHAALAPIGPRRLSPDSRVPAVQESGLGTSVLQGQGKPADRRCCRTSPARGFDRDRNRTAAAQPPPRFPLGQLRIRVSRPLPPALAG